MNEPGIPTGPTVAATIMIGGLMALAFPQHALSIVQVVLVTFAALAGLHALSIIAPEGSVTGLWSSPFDRSPRDRPDAEHSSEIATLRAKLSARRVAIPGAPTLPPEMLRLLRSLIVVALQRAGVDPDDETGQASIRERLSPLTRALLTSNPPNSPRWINRRRAAPRRVAGVVQRVLDDLDRFDAGPGPGPTSPTTHSAP